MDLYKSCTKCFLYKPIEDFPWKYKSLNIRHAVCKECTAKRSNDWYKNNRKHHIQTVNRNRTADKDRARKYVLDYLKSHPCSVCGEADPVVLEFHHLGNKEREVATLINDGVNMDRLKAEMAKCEVMCANCHRKVTAKERGWFRSRE